MMEDEFILSVPLLFVAFNRPDTTKIAFEKIRNVRPKILYVVVDGPRQNIEDDNDLITEVKRIVHQVDWKCKVNYKFNIINSGAETTVSSAITWVLNNEECAIILEDDILAPVSFFRFEEEMLLKYHNEEKVCMVSGCNFSPMNNHNNEDYYFSKYGHISGWGTWRRAWNKFDLNIDNFTEVVNYTNLRKTCESKNETMYFLKKYKALMKNGAGNNTWDSCWGYIYRTNGLFSIVPRVHLTSNIGVYGLHSSGVTEHHFRQYDENFIVKKHPVNIEKYIDYENYHYKYYIKRLQNSLYRRLINKVSRLIRQIMT